MNYQIDEISFKFWKYKETGLPIVQYIILITVPILLNNTNKIGLLNNM